MDKPLRLVDGNKKDLPGVLFRPVYLFHILQTCGTQCGGVQVIIADREAVDSCLTGLTLYKTVGPLPRETQWLPPYRKDTLAGIDRLMGTDKVRRGLESR